LKQRKVNTMTLYISWSIGNYKQHNNYAQIFFGNLHS